MNCDEFEVILPDFLEGELSGQGNSEALSHIKSCKKCDDMLQELIIIRREFSGSFNYSEVDFNSKKQQIIDSIDKNKYKRKTSNLRRNAVIASTIAATVAGVIILNPYIKNHLGNNIQVESINDIGKGKDGESLMGSSINIKGNIYTEMRKAVDEKFNTVGDVVMNDKDNIYSKLKENNRNWIGDIVNEGDFTVFQKGQYLFGYDKKSEKYYGFIDLSKVDKGNKERMIFATNDGRFIVWGNSDLNDKKEDSCIYIVDLITNEVSCIENQNIWQLEVGIGNKVDSIVLLDKNSAIEFENLTVSKIPKKYNNENMKEILDKDIRIYDWNEALKGLSQKVYGDKLMDDDQIICYENQKLYVKRKESLLEITKNGVKIIKDKGFKYGSHVGLNLFYSDDKDLSIFNIETKAKYSYEDTRNLRVSYNGSYIVDIEGDKDWLTVKFPKQDNKSPMKIIEKKYITSKSLIITDSQNRLTVISEIDKDKVFNIKTIKVK